MHPLDIVDVVCLALIHGVAEVLPLDASGHAALMAHLTGWKAASIIVSIQAGALLALLAWLWRDIKLIGQGLWKLFSKRRIEPGTVLLGKALIASLPWMLADGFLGQVPLGLAVVGLLTILGALVMGVVDRLSMTVKRIEHLTALTSLAVGVIQLTAILPGVGRLAAALTVARSTGMERPAAYRFILLATVPPLLVSLVRLWLGYALQGIGPASVDLLAFSLSLVLTLGGILLAHSWLQRGSLMPFALYRLGLGGLLIWLSL